MSDNNTSQDSPSTTGLIQIAIIAVLIFAIFQLYRLDESNLHIKTQINQMTPKLDSAFRSLTEARRHIDSLNSRITYFDDSLTSLTRERDSLVNALKQQTQAGWSTMQNSLNRQREINLELNLLRERNKEFK